MGTERFNGEDPIQLRRVSMSFGKFKAVNDLTLSIREGENITLLGHNGAGKTTTIYALTGMYHLSAGDVTVKGLSIRRDMEAIRRQIGLC